MNRSRRITPRGRLVAALAILAIVVPGPALGAAGSGSAKPSTDSYRTTSASFVGPGAVAGVTFQPLINSGETAFGTVFEGIPDGIGVVPGAGPHGYVDLYVAHEQSRVPFGTADLQDSSVSRVRVDLETKRIIAMEVVLSPDEGFIRFCSAFMAGPEHGFPHYTFLVNEESNDPLVVPAGAVYGPDPAYGSLNQRQAGYSVFLDTANGKIGVLSNAGRHNHENQVIVPGGWKGIYSVSGDDSFASPSTPARPNLSQLYMFASKNWQSFQKDEGSLWAFRVTATQAGPIADPLTYTGANDYLDMVGSDDWKGEFIAVPGDVARGETVALPQDALEDWSNEKNVFQFVRVEDIAYDPDNPRVLYFADSGTSRLTPTGTGRLYRAGSGGTTTLGRIFRMELDADDPTKVVSFRIVDTSSIAMRNPDNIEVGHDSLMVQEDVSNAKIWRYSLDAAIPAWSHVATATQSGAETSGIVDVSNWFGDGWWALDVQSHIPIAGSEVTRTYAGPGSQNGVIHTARREQGQLLLMYVPGS
ncbi:MAG: hypothetical protein HW391_708 [Chloroflexi bacterium]|nr:hypothetical protein [Chloroflexota bacterium]